MIVINLTPHTVRVQPLDGPEVVFPAQGQVARIREIVGDAVQIQTAQGTVPLQSVSYSSSVDDLPEPAPGVLHLVSRATAAAVGRKDLVFPQGEIRDQTGAIIACRSLGTFHPGLG